VPVRQVQIILFRNKVQIILTGQGSKSFIVAKKIHGTVAFGVRLPSQAKQYCAVVKQAGMRPGSVSEGDLHEIGDRVACVGEAKTTEFGFSATPDSCR
jgi:hypothetical protein